MLYEVITDHNRPETLLARTPADFQPITKDGYVNADLRKKRIEQECEQLKSPPPKRGRMKIPNLESELRREFNERRIDFDKKCEVHACEDDRREPEWPNIQAFYDPKVFA